MPKSAEQLQAELVHWLRTNATNYRVEARLSERKTHKDRKAAKADTYDHVANIVANWSLD